MRPPRRRTQPNSRSSAITLALVKIAPSNVSERVWQRSQTRLYSVSKATRHLRVELGQATRCIANIRARNPRASTRASVLLGTAAEPACTLKIGVPKEMARWVLLDLLERAIFRFPLGFRLHHDIAPELDAIPLFLPRNIYLLGILWTTALGFGLEHVPFPFWSSSVRFVLRASSVLSGGRPFSVLN